MSTDVDAHRSRIDRARGALRARGLDALMLGPGADFRYLLGYETMPMERLTMLVLPAEGSPRLVTPGFEAALAGDAPDRLEIDLAAWPEAADPIALAADAVPRGARRVAAGDGLAAMFLLPLERRLDGAEFVLGSEVMVPLRLIKDAAELDELAAAAAAIDRAVDRVPELLAEGVREADLAAALDLAIREEGHAQTDFTDIGSGPNGASPHHTYSDRAIAKGDAVVVDIGGRRASGYRSDITRVFARGEPPAEFMEAYEVLLAAQRAGREAVRPGVTCAAVDAACREPIEAAGLGELFTHRTGHGLGLDVHEDPYIVEGEERVLEPGMVFSIEPGIYVPGRFGARIEDIVVCTPEGGRSLNASERDLRIA